MPKRIVRYAEEMSRDEHWIRLYELMNTLPGLMVVIGTFSGMAYLASQLVSDNDHLRRRGVKVFWGVILACLTGGACYLILKEFMPDNVAMGISFFIGSSGEAGFLLMQHNIRKRFGEQSNVDRR